MLKKLSPIKHIAIFSVLVLSTFSLPGFAQSSNPSQPGGLGTGGAVTNLLPSAPSQSVTVTPGSASDSLATPIYTTNATVCLEEFNWEKFAADLRNNTPNSNPYDSKGCVQQDRLTSNGSRNIVTNAANRVTAVNYTVGNNVVNKLKYKDFTTGTATTKAAFGELPVLGIFPNPANGAPKAQSIGTYTITGQQVNAGTNANRGELAGLGSIYTAPELNSLYGANTARTGAPRLVFTGPDTLNTSVSPATYNGGNCKANSSTGKMQVRTKFLEGTPSEVNATESITGSRATPITSCKFIFPGGTDSQVVLDQSMQIYQFVYVINYPTVQQCQTLFNIFPQNYVVSCLNFYKDRLGKVFAGSSTGDKVVYTFTYYGMFSDANTIPFRFGPNGAWKNPDINGPRKTYTSTATAAQLNAYYPGSPLTEAQKRGAFEGYIRAADGYSIYTL